MRLHSASVSHFGGLRRLCRVTPKLLGKACAVNVAALTLFVFLPRVS